MSRPPEGPKLRPNPKRSGTYYIYWTDERTGRSREHSTGTGDQGRALEYFAQWLGRRGPAPWTGPRRASDAPIIDMLAMYAREHVAERVVSKETAAYAIAALSRWWGDRTCDYVKPETCRAYVRARTSPSHTAPCASDHFRDVTEMVDGGSHQAIQAGRMKGPGVAESTAARELTVLRAALGYAHKNGKLLDRPFVELPPRPPGRDRWLTRDEAARLLWESRKDPQASGHLPLFILLALATGARPGALFDLRWTQIDFDRDRIDFNPPGRKRTSKGRPIIAIPRRLRWFLLRAHARASSPYVLAFNGRKLKGVRRAFRRARERAGLGSEVVPYVLRHSCACWLAQAGVPIWQIGGWLGHSQQRTTELYAHHHPDHFKDARKVMD